MTEDTYTTATQGSSPDAIAWRLTEVENADHKGTDQAWDR